MAFVESFAGYFADYGVDATLNGTTVRGIFDDAYGDAFGGMIAGSGPMFRLPSTVAVSRGDTLVMGAKTYTVVTIEPDGTGLTVLRMDQA